MTVGRWIKTVFPFWRIAAKVAGVRGGVYVHRNIPYHAFANGKKLRLDIYLRGRTDAENDIERNSGSGSGKRGCLLYIHGGGFVAGDKSFASVPLLYQAAAANWVVISINYRLSPFVALPMHLIDCKRALKWVKTIGCEKFSIDPNLVIVAGESAGGHLALMMALTANVKAYQPEFEDIDTSLAGCIDLYGVHDISDSHNQWARFDFGAMNAFMRKVVVQSSKSEIVNSVSPLWIIQQPTMVTTKEKIPPIMSIHGTHDSLVPIVDADIFHENLATLRQRIVTHNSMNVGDENNNVNDVDDIFIKLPNTHHAFNYLMSARSVAMGDTVVSYMSQIARNAGARPKL